MRKKNLSEKFYTLQEVRKILRVSERSVFRYIHSGKLPATKIGYWRISKSGLVQFLLKTKNGNLQTEMSFGEFVVPTSHKLNKNPKKKNKK